MAYLINNSTANSVYLTAAGAAGTQYSIDTSSSNGTWATVNQTPMTVNHGGKIELKGDNADIEINGVSLKETLDGIQSRLGMLKPNPHLEKEWEELKALGDAYRKMEADIKAKMKTWDILNKE